VASRTLLLEIQLRYSYRRETFTIEGQWPLDHASKVSRWQHRAMRRGARFAVIDTTASCCCTALADSARAWAAV